MRGAAEGLPGAPAALRRWQQPWSIEPEAWELASADGSSRNCSGAWLGIGTGLGRSHLPAVLGTGKCDIWGGAVVAVVGEEPSLASLLQLFERVSEREGKAEPGDL